MTFTIRPPAPASPPYHSASSSAASSDDSLDSEGDTSMLQTPHPTKRAKLSSSTSIITPGELITDDPQWMRCAPSPTIPTTTPSPHPRPPN